MALIVEDGTGLANADAFVSVADCQAYAEDNNLTDWLDGSGDQEAAIRRATTFLSNSFTWKGWKLRGRLQALAWPRTDVVDEEEQEVATDAVPVEVVNATCELAAYEMANPGGLSPTVIMSDRVKSERVGPLSVDYVGTVSADSYRPEFLLVTDMIAGLLETSAASTLTGTVARI